MSALMIWNGRSRVLATAFAATTIGILIGGSRKAPGSDLIVTAREEPPIEIRKALIPSAEAPADAEVRSAQPVLRQDASGGVAGIAGYFGHRIANGETVRDIAQRGG